MLQGESRCQVLRFSGMDLRRNPAYKLVVKISSHIKSLSSRAPRLYRTEITSDVRAQTGNRTVDGGSAETHRAERLANSVALASSPGLGLRGPLGEVLPVALVCMCLLCYNSTKGEGRNFRKTLLTCMYVAGQLREPARTVAFEHRVVSGIEK